MTDLRKLNRWLGGGALAVTGVLGTIVYVPAVLAFPHRAQFGEITVYSVSPIGPEMPAILDRAAKRNAASAIVAPLGPRAIYLTDGGWRWNLLSLPTSHGAFAVTRPFSTNIVVNRASIAGDGVENSAAIGNRRTLSGTIAHETTHLLIQQRYGLAARAFATWKVEGYCDHVAQESSLSDAQAASLRAAGKSTPGLVYHEARRKVAAALASGKSVDQLFKN
ncbi:hypothetical protein ACCC88_01785 [Sphingomonas sp. Sphisp140]|uniref:hypothetical protein n=1 Tax=unclassified Sphingomonas TaxID=196159 RepID=UPI0039B03352